MEKPDIYHQPQTYIVWLEQQHMGKANELNRKINALQTELKEIEQTLGRALGFPRYCDDQKNFPGTTDADGVCTGDATPAALAIMAAARIKELELDASF